MNYQEHHAHFLYGSGGIADEQSMRTGGIYNKTSGGPFIGKDERGRNCYGPNDQSGGVLIGGARGLKGSLITPWMIDGQLAHYHHVIMDWKGTQACLNSVMPDRRIVNYNPRKRHGLHSNRIDLLSYIHADSPTLVSDALQFAMDWIPYSSAPQAAYFEGNAQRTLAASIVTGARRWGRISLAHLSELMAGFGGDSTKWLDFEFELGEQPEEEIKEVARDLKAIRKQGGDSGGLRGIKGEIAKSFTCMMDPAIKDSVSNPDFCFSELMEDDCIPTTINMMESQEFAFTSAPIVRCFYAALRIYKYRAPHARPIWLCHDEIGNVGKWPSAVLQATEGAGYGLKAYFIAQSSAQLEALGPPGSAQKILNSCSLQIWTAVRDEIEARKVSSLFGTTTVRHDDFVQQRRARHNQQNAIMEMALGDGDPMRALMDMQHHGALASYQSKQQRLVITPDEVMNAPEGTAFVFLRGKLERPMILLIPPYWRRKELAGKYGPDPHFPKHGGDVEVATLFGQRVRKIISEDAPAYMRNWPQCRMTGKRLYVEGFRP